MATEPGTVMTCEGDDCACRVVIERPCPHGDDYRCGCGRALTPVDD